MLLKQEGLLHKSPEFCQAVKFVIKLQISTLLQQLAESGEESVVLTANVLDGTADHLGSNRGAGFLEDHEQLQKQFLSYCAETRRISVHEEADNLPPSTSFNDNNLFLPTLSSSVSLGSCNRSDPVRTCYERESSTSDSVFSPDRRKSSASSKSLEEDVSMVSNQDYSDFHRSQSDLSVTWPDSVGPSVDIINRGIVLRYSTSRSPTNKIGDTGEKLKHVLKSPVNENTEHIKRISLSSPSEFQYKRHHHSYSSATVGSFDPQRLPPTIEMAVPIHESPFLLPVGNDHSPAFPKTNSNTNLAVSCAEDSISDSSPVNLVSPLGKISMSGESSPVNSTGMESVFSPYVMYKVPYSSSHRDRVGTFKVPTTEDTVSGLYRQEYEGENSENKSKCTYSSSENMVGQFDQSELFITTEGREYTSELGEVYRLPKKIETKIYHKHGNTAARKQPKACLDFQTSNACNIQSFESSSFVQIKDQNILKEPEKFAAGMTSAEITKSFEEAVKIQQTLLQSRLFSPLQRHFVVPSHQHHLIRERSQSLSEFHTGASELCAASGRTRFPSSSFSENLDAPLVIDDDLKIESETREGLDLSNKKRKMYIDDVISSGSNDTFQETISGRNILGSQAEEQEYEHLSQNQNASISTASSSDETSNATKKYGKGNFIKVATGYQCRICCRVIRHMNNTTAHMRIHANVKPYKCQVCNQQFKYEVDRRYHFSKNHVDLFGKMYIPDDKKMGNA